MKLKVLSIVGTRPNFMKIAPLVAEFKKYKDVKHVLVHTGQHYDNAMSKLFFDELGLPKPDEHLFCPAGSKVDQQRNLLKNVIKAALEKQKPDLVIVVGDVNSTVAGAEAAHELGIKVAHVEAGLRSFDKTMPEEINRIRTDQVSDFLFTTEKSANFNLLKEGISKDKIFFVGNVMIDTLLNHREKAKQSKILDELKLRKKEYCVLTLHRPSNVDNKESFKNVMYILGDIEKRIKIVFPVHPRTMKNIKKFNFDKKIKYLKNLILTEPLGYLDFLCLMDNSMFIITDSGGIQEETTVLGVPCLTLRKNTERPVTAEQGTNLLVSVNKKKVIKKAIEIIGDRINAKNKIPELWDGKAAKRIVEIIIKECC